MRELQKKEAIKRLEILERKFGRVYGNVKEKFSQGEIYVSELIPVFDSVNYERWVSNGRKAQDVEKYATFIGKLYNVNNDMMKKIKSWEEETGNLVYTCISSNTNCGLWFDFLYVSTYAEEWEEDRELLIEENYIYIYCENLTYSEYSEYGGIRIEGTKEGIRRS